jgi:hypothetical protein
MTSRRSVAVLAVALGGVASCGELPPVRAQPAVQQRPEEAIFAISRTWQARWGERGLQSSPSPVASFDRQLTSRLELVRGVQSATETIDFTERFVLREGGEVRCSGHAEGELTVQYGRRQGEPAIELSWPILLAPRVCDTPKLDPTYERPAGLSRFVLRSDQLVGLGSALERRTFLPAD